MTRGQRWADAVTQFSGSWSFIGWFAFICVVWIVHNSVGTGQWDRYPFLFLNWLLTIVSTFQSPLILLSQNRQNDMDRERMRAITATLGELARVQSEILQLQLELMDELRSHHRRP